MFREQLHIWKDLENEVKMEKRGVLGGTLLLPSHVICFNLMETTEGWKLPACRNLRVDNYKE